MLSLKTCIELVYVIENLTQAEVDRIFHVFNLTIYISPPSDKSKAKKANILFEHFKSPTLAGPFSNNLQLDMLQYLVDNFYRNAKEDIFNYEDLFFLSQPSLANSLKRDGYVVKGKMIKKILPEEIVEAKTESELAKLLDKFGLRDAKGHLEQAIDNHSRGNWAAANGQFRPFVEDLLIGIANKILSANPCDSAASAIKLLSSTANPPFLKADLNEVESSNCNKPFIEGLWKRLHPEGSHPGLSDEEDCTFRYHMVIVFAYSLLRRLETWLVNKSKTK